MVICNMFVTGWNIGNIKYSTPPRVCPGEAIFKYSVEEVNNFCNMLKSCSLRMDLFNLQDGDHLDKMQLTLLKVFSLCVGVSRIFVISRGLKMILISTTLLWVSSLKLTFSRQTLGGALYCCTMNPCTVHSNT